MKKKTVFIAEDEPLARETLRDAILAHPTMAEGLGPLFARVPERQGAGG